MPRAYSYHVIAEPIELAVSIAKVREWLKLSPTEPSDDDLELLIRSATEFAECYTKRTFINTTFRTYRDFFECCIKLRRSKLQTITLFEYSVNDVFIIVPATLYYTTNETAFSKIVLKTNKQYPDDIDEKLDSIKIEFVAGFGANSTDIPYKLRIALLNHIAALYENRGDCDQNLSDKFLEKSLPATSRLAYSQSRIMDLHDGCI
jgi:uncharacterized phiE125 gp8 family phage protein